MAIRDQFLRLLNPPQQYDEPKDWPQLKKNMIVLAIAYIAFTSPVAVSVYFPAAIEMQKEFHTTPTFIAATVSVFILVIGIVPVFWASLCDYMGRRPIYIISMTIAVIGTVGCGLAKSIGLFFTFRILQGLGSSSVVAVGSGTLSDVFYPGERGTAFGLFYLGPLVGPVAGPLLGGALAEAYGWRSTMWLMLAFLVLAWLLVLFVLPETYRERVNGVVVSPPSKEVSGAAAVGEESEAAASVPSSVIYPRSASAHEIIVIERIPSPCASEEEGTVTEEPITSSFVSADHSLVTADASSSLDKPATSAATAIPSSVSTPLPHPQAAEKETVELLVPSAAPGIHDIESMPRLASPITSTHSHSTSTRSNSPANTKPAMFNPLRPLVCLRHRINFLAVMYNALGFGGQICMLSTMPISFSQSYGLSESKIGMAMMSLGIGLGLGSVLGGRYSDYVVRRWLLRQEKKKEKEKEEEEMRRTVMKEKTRTASRPSLEQAATTAPQDGHRTTLSLSLEQENNGDSNSEGRERTEDEVTGEKNEQERTFQSKVTVRTKAPPEVRLQSTWIGAFILPTGFLIYGWSIQKGAPLVAPLIGSFLTGFGMMMVMSSTATVLVDANADKNMAAAAVSCNSFVRGITGAVGGVVALPMMNAMGNGWLYTFWASVVAVGFGGIAIIIFRVEAWRQRKQKNRDLEK
ncbi:hypothetical protein BGZ73_002078 [Actinomortierella ambigua]|nr:hypothetical protein BGZ73_002078 [Actinomortierella ambigua]